MEVSKKLISQKKKHDSRCIIIDQLVTQVHISELVLKEEIAVGGDIQSV